MSANWDPLPSSASIKIESPRPTSSTVMSNRLPGTRRSCVSGGESQHGFRRRRADIAGELMEWRQREECQRIRRFDDLQSGGVDRRARGLMLLGAGWFAAELGVRVRVVAACGLGDAWGRVVGAGVGWVGSPPASLLAWVARSAWRLSGGGSSRRRALATERWTEQGARSEAQDGAAGSFGNGSRRANWAPPSHLSRTDNGECACSAPTRGGRVTGCRCLWFDSCLLGSRAPPRDASADRSWRWPRCYRRRRSCPSRGRGDSW